MTLSSRGHGAFVIRRAKEGTIRIKNTASSVEAIERQRVHKKQFVARVRELIRFREQVKEELIKRIEMEKIKNPNSGIIFILALDDWLVEQARHTATKFHARAHVQEGKLRAIKGKRRRHLIISIAKQRSEMFGTTQKEEKARLGLEIEAKKDQITKTAKASRV